MCAIRGGFKSKSYLGAVFSQGEKQERGKKKADLRSMLPREEIKKKEGKTVTRFS